MSRIYKREDRGGYYYIVYYDENGKKRHLKASKDRYVAEQLLKEEEREVELIKAGLKTRVNNNKSVSEILKPYLRFIELHRRPRTVTRIKNALGNILNKLCGLYDAPATITSPEVYKINACDITMEKILYYQNERVRECSVRTTNLEVKALKTFLTWAVNSNLINNNPINNIQHLRKNPVKVRRALTDQEVNKLLAACSENIKPAIKTFLYTGMRRNELVSLKWEDVNLDRNTIHIKSEVAKTHKSRTLPINKDLRKILLELKNSSNSDLVFTNSEGTQWKGSLYVAYKKAVAKSGIKRPEQIDLHCLRYTFGTSLLRQGTNIKVLQDLLGHADINTTLQIYCQVFSIDTHEAVDKLPSYDDKDSENNIEENYFPQAS